jgi:hypothetical protein
MSAKTAILFLSICLTIAPCFAKQNSATNSQQNQSAKASMSHEDVQALRADLDRMRSLVHQMEVNLAFATPTETPLRHQFELEIDMWKSVIQHMERRLPHTDTH